MAATYKPIQDAVDIVMKDLDVSGDLHEVSMYIELTDNIDHLAINVEIYSDKPKFVLSIFLRENTKDGVEIAFCNYTNIETLDGIDGMEWVPFPDLLTTTHEHLTTAITLMESATIN